MKSTEIKDSRYNISKQLEKAKRYQKIANTITDVRAKSGTPLGVAHIFAGRKWSLFFTSGTSAATDAIDGKIARISHKITDDLALPRVSTKGSVDDPDADRRLFDGLMYGQITRHFVDREYISAGSKIATMGLVKWRDHRQAKLRDEAISQNKIVDAIPINKIKAEILIGAAVAGESPILNDSRARAAQNITLLIGAGLGWYGHFVFRDHLAQQEPCTMPSKNALGDTTQEIS